MLRYRSGLCHICFRKAPANVMYPQDVGGNKPEQIKKIIGGGKTERKGKI